MQSFLLIQRVILYWFNEQYNNVRIRQNYCGVFLFQNGQK
jgi:hypothetical protein